MVSEVLLDIVHSVLETNHASASIKSVQPGECDFRITSLGDGVSVLVDDDSNFTVTDEDEEEIIEAVSDECGDCEVTVKRSSINGAAFFEVSV